MGEGRDRIDYSFNLNLVLRELKSKKNFLTLLDEVFNYYVDNSLRNVRLLTYNKLTETDCVRIDKSYKEVYCEQFKRTFCKSSEVKCKAIDRYLRDLFITLQGFIEDFTIYSAKVFKYSSIDSPDRVDRLEFLNWINKNENKYKNLYVKLSEIYVIRNRIVHDRPSLQGLCNIRIAYLISSFYNDVYLDKSIRDNIDYLLSYGINNSNNFKVLEMSI